MSTLFRTILNFQLGPTILAKPKGTYHYLISTYTGSRQGAGTTARVVFKMAGDYGETEPVRLKDRHRPCFERGQENSFLVSYPKGIGDLSYLQIWHDNSGLQLSLFMFVITLGYVLLANWEALLSKPFRLNQVE